MLTTISICDRFDNKLLFNMVVTTVVMI